MELGPRCWRKTWRRSLKMNAAASTAGGTPFRAAGDAEGGAVNSTPDADDVASALSAPSNGVDANGGRERIGAAATKTEQSGESTRSRARHAQADKRSGGEEVRTRMQRTMTRSKGRPCRSWSSKSHAKEWLAFGSNLVLWRLRTTKATRALPRPANSAHGAVSRRMGRSQTTAAKEWARRPSAATST